MDDFFKRFPTVKVATKNTLVKKPGDDPVLHVRAKFVKGYRNALMR